MAVRVRLEVSNLATRHISGVGHYTRLLGEALSYDAEVKLTAPYFNFLGRQPTPAVSFTDALRVNRFIPLRIYAKLAAARVALPFDLTSKQTDLTIFPNFATWPTIHSGLTATVIHDLAFLQFGDSVEEKNLRYLKKTVPYSIKKANFIITVSESIKAEIIEEYKVQPHCVIVTPIPPDETFFATHTQGQIDDVKKKYGLDLDKGYIYFIGNREPRKNLATLVDAYRQLPQTSQRSHSLVIAGGKGWKTEEADIAINDAKADGLDVRLIGYIDQVDSPALYAGATMCVMPSLYEGFGMPVLEAMASGCPVVASDTAVFHEVGGEAITYADPESIDSFARAIQNTINRIRPDRTALVRIVRRFSWANNVRTIMDIIRSTS